MTRRKTTTVESDLLRGLRATFDPLVQALDQRPAMLQEEISESRDAATDTGRPRPSTKDSGMRILIGQLCQTIWRQQYGMIRTKSGSIPNNDQRLKKSESDFQDLNEQVQEQKITMESTHAVHVMHWFDVNERRFDACNELLVSLSTLYREVFNEDWKPLVAEDSPTKEVRRTHKADISPEENARLVALSERFKNRIARVA